MTLTVSVKIDPIDPLKELEVKDLEPPKREVYIDDKKVPDSLAEIILLGLDVKMNCYLDEVEARMKADNKVK